MSGYDPLALADWQRIRRYAVPAWMIAEATAARQRGDWRGACEAALVDVRIDDPSPVAGLLSGLAPDLLRWHLPRALGGSTELAAEKTYVLAPDGPVVPATPVLVARVPAGLPGADPLVLEAMQAGEIESDLFFPVPPRLWDARRAGELRALARPSPAAAAGAEAWATDGWLFGEDDGPAWQPRDESLSPLDPVLTARELRRSAAQFGRRSWAIWAGRYREEMRFRADGDRVRITTAWGLGSEPNPFRAVPCLHPGLLRASVDLDLVGHGLIDPDDVHPLVREALFPPAGSREAASVPSPAAGVPFLTTAVPSLTAPVPSTSTQVPSPSGASPNRVSAVPDRGSVATPRPDTEIVPAGFGEEQLIRVRCGTGWHRISLRNGRLTLPAHTDAERQRERSLRAFGGVSGGCFTAELSWHGGDETPPPKRLRVYRRDLWLRMRHGGTRTVVALLDAGMDPHIRDGRGRTLLHRIRGFDHTRLLPRLLAAGLDVDARDQTNSTALFEAVLHRWPADLIIALVDAGADPRLTSRGQSPLDLLDDGEVRDDAEWRSVTAYLRERA
jgi:hypothetical protein